MLQSSDWALRRFWSLQRRPCNVDVGAPGGGCEVLQRSSTGNALDCASTAASAVLAPLFPDAAYRYLRVWRAGEVAGTSSCARKGPSTSSSTSGVVFPWRLIRERCVAMDARAAQGTPAPTRAVIVATEWKPLDVPLLLSNASFGSSSMARGRPRVRSGGSRAALLQFKVSKVRKTIR
jgi:hypothetical protein